MPIFEYACQSCGHEFETLSRTSVQPECPKCHSAALDKKLSVFATAGSSAGRSSEMALSGPCGTCGHPDGPGACSLPN